MKSSTLKIGLLAIVLFCIGLIVHQYTMIKKYKDELSRKEYQIRELQTSVDKWKNQLYVVEKNLKNCNMNLDINRYNNSRLEMEKWHKETQEFFNMNQ
jgi:septal ring factor EnvC (AmiA/AmiB activator)